MVVFSAFGPDENEMVEPKAGAEGRDRTADLTITNRLLYQLSYLGKSTSS